MKAGEVVFSEQKGLFFSIHSMDSDHFLGVWHTKENTLDLAREDKKLFRKSSFLEYFNKQERRKHET